MLNDLLDETNSLNYQIIVKCIEIESSPVYFNSTSKTLINHKFDLHTYFLKVLYTFDNYINEGSGWIVESIYSRYIIISRSISLS